MVWWREAETQWFYVQQKTQAGPANLAGLIELYEKGRGGGIDDNTRSSGQRRCPAG